ncbi:hypothetical protein ACFC1D_28865 [Streptomyces vinaceus]|uniref:hypothetical protein n=1 Tax=Streptomyces vinaceus TaxID=1960 RepID=UPI0035D69CE6
MTSVTVVGAFSGGFAGVLADGPGDAVVPSCAVGLAARAGWMPADADPVISAATTPADSAAALALETIPTRVPQRGVPDGVFAGMHASRRLPVRGGRG